MAAIIRLAALVLVVTVVWGKNTSGKSTFCCDITPPTKVIETPKYKPVKRTKWEEKNIIIGYEDCGIVGQSVCPMYQNVWNEVVYYTMESVIEKQTINLPCPDSHVVCCQGYEKYQNNCYKPDEIENLKQLESLGILG